MRAFILLGLLISNQALLAACKDKQYYPDVLFPEVLLSTSAGDILIEMDRQKAPLTVNNFLYHVETKAFNDSLFHRVIKDYVVQTGAYKKDLSPVTGCGKVYNESGNGLKNEKGTVAMARYNDPHSAQSSFYFNMNDNSNLDPSAKNWGYTVFAYVIEGVDVLEKIAQTPTGYNQELDAQDVPESPIYIKEVKLTNE